MNNKHFTIGAIFGLIAPVLGLFAGLQVTPVLGTILMFPFILIGEIMGQPFGEFSTVMKIVCTLLSIGVWGLIFMFLGSVFFKSE